MEVNVKSIKIMEMVTTYKLLVDKLPYIVKESCIEGDKPEEMKIEYDVYDEQGHGVKKDTELFHSVMNAIDKFHEDED